MRKEILNITLRSQAGNNRLKVLCNLTLTLFRMGFLGVGLSHISYSDETWHSYTLAKEDSKNI